MMGRLKFGDSLSNGLLVHVSGRRALLLGLEAEGSDIGS